MNNKLKPAIIGGIVLGLLSAIPIVNWANYCCCLWAILGGLIAARVYIKASPTPVGSGEGATVGVLAGVVGALIYIVIGIPLAIVAQTLVMGLLLRLVESANPSQVEMFREMQAGQSVLRTILVGFVVAVLTVGFSTVGGLLGIPLFEKRKGTGDMPPPPQGFGGVPPGGGFGSAA